MLESGSLYRYQGRAGLGANNAPGLSRFEGATSTGRYLLARIDFEDCRLPVQVGRQGRRLPPLQLTMKLDVHIFRQVISTFTGISFLMGTVRNDGRSILKSEQVAGIVPVIRTSLPWVTR